MPEQNCAHAREHFALQRLGEHVGQVVRAGHLAQFDRPHGNAVPKHCQTAGDPSRVLAQPFHVRFIDGDLRAVYSGVGSCSKLKFASRMSARNPRIHRYSLVTSINVH